MTAPATTATRPRDADRTCDAVAPRDADPPRGTVGRLLIEDSPRTGAWNMAIDEVLLESALAGTSSFRWYRWSEPTLSLGWFQDEAEVRRDPRWRGVPVVRRLSGGGALLHDAEQTYACALAADHPWAVQPLELYDRVHAAIVSALRNAGWSARLFGAEDDRDPRGVSESPPEESQHGSEPAAARTAEPFLCFARRDRRDVVVGDAKVGGSAQRRRRGAVLQHGSLLLRSSAAAPELPGLFDLPVLAGAPPSSRTSVAPPGSEPAWGGTLPIDVARAIFAEVVPAELTKTEQDRVAEIAACLAGGVSRTGRLGRPTGAARDSAGPFAEGSHLPAAPLIDSLAPD
jgi:lipoate-protein ligase A